MSATARTVTAAALRELGERYGLDAIGATSVGAYETTERHIAERRARGLFGDLRFTLTRTERSCHPERVLPEARSVVAAALCYWVEATEPPPGHGRLPRYAWRDAYADLRERLEAVGRELGGVWRVLVDDNDHVDREAAVRAGVGFYGKNTLVINRRHGSWIVLGTLLTSVEIERREPVRAGCGACTLCIDACPTDAIVEPGVLDATLCLSTLTQQPGAIPESAMAALGDRVYGCDICQDVCPWNRGVERRRATLVPTAVEPSVPLADWLAPLATARLERDVDRLFVPRNDPRWLRRNALVALGNVGRADDAVLAEPYLVAEDELLRSVAERAVTLIDARTQASPSATG
jgi:epoxyqueuosine reductase